MRAFSRKQWLIVVVAVVLVLILVSATLLLRTWPQTPSFSLTAGIIDQLGEEIPNPAFVENVTAVLESHGFNVTYHGGVLDVDFFRKLAEYNYGIVVLREHSALRDDHSTVDLFTSEPYDPSVHIAEQDSGMLVQGTLNYTAVPTTYFAITARFIENLEGDFPRSIVIAMGCNTMVPGLEQLAEAFIKKGASAFIGWNGYVLNTNTDEETAKLISKLIVNQETIYGAIQGALDTRYGSEMAYYPPSAGNLRISNLTSTVSDLSGIQFTALNFWPFAQSAYYKTSQLEQSEATVPATYIALEVTTKSRRISETCLNTRLQWDSSGIYSVLKLPDRADL